MGEEERGLKAGEERGLRRRGDGAGGNDTVREVSVDCESGRNVCKGGFGGGAGLLRSGGKSMCSGGEITYTKTSKKESKT